MESIKSETGEEELNERELIGKSGQSACLAVGPHQTFHPAVVLLLVAAGKALRRSIVRRLGEKLSEKDWRRLNEKMNKKIG